MTCQKGQRISAFTQKKLSEVGTSIILHPEGPGRSLCLLKWAEKTGVTTNPNNSVAEDF